LTNSVQIRGFGWDHPRCMSPLLASATDFKQQHPEVEIIWNSRSLYDFGEGSLDDLLADYDLIIFDHPYIGDIANHKWFINLAEKLSNEEISRFEKDSLGPSWQSYQNNSGIWGLPIDAAAQVASYRPDLMEQVGHLVPESISDVLKLARQARKQNMWIALPLVPCDAICTFLTLTANMGNAVAHDGSSFPDHAECKHVLETMKELTQVIHPESLKWNPIECYNHMSVHDDVCYVPYAFGYTNYSRNNSLKMIKYCDIPGMESDSCSGAVIGGAAIGISARTKHPELSIEYAKFLCNSGYQGAKYYVNGGQPASLSAWQNKTNDANSHEFFSGTISTMENAYLRPTFSGFVQYFRDAGIQINSYLRDGTNLTNVTGWLISNYVKLR